MLISYPYGSRPTPWGQRGGAKKGSNRLKLQKSSKILDIVESNNYRWKGLKVFYKNCELYDLGVLRYPLGRGQVYFSLYRKNIFVNIICPIFVGN